MGTLAPGDGGSPALDMRNSKDRVLLRDSIAKGWPIRAEDLRKYYEALGEALAIAREEGNARNINACVKTMVAIVGQVQADEHVEIKAETAAPQVNITVLNIQPPRLLGEAT